MRGVFLTVSVALLGAMAPAATARTAAPAATTERQKLTASAADVEFAIATLESALKQYHALPEAKKVKLENRVAQFAEVKDPALVAQVARGFAASVQKQPLSTPENRALVKRFLDANPKWCGAVKATRAGRRVLRKMGLAQGEMSLEEIVNLLPE